MLYCLILGGARVENTGVNSFGFTIQKSESPMEKRKIIEKNPID
jgi:hypothetical protein